jgi:hypothetical protein
MDQLDESIHPNSPPRRSERLKQTTRPNYAEANITLTIEPTSYQEATNGEHSQQWTEAIQKEYDSLLTNGTWSLTALPRGRKAIGNKWVFRIKHNSDGTVERFKAQLVAKGFSQQPGVDFDKTYAPVARMSSI